MDTKGIKTMTEEKQSLFGDSLFGKTTSHTEAPTERAKKKATPRPLPEINKKGGMLFIPESMKQRFKEDGFDLAWLLIYNGDGSLNVKEIRKKESEGYTFVTRSDAPEMGSEMSSFFGEELDKHGELITVLDVALGKIPSSIIRARTKALEDETKRRSNSIVKDLRKHQIGDAARGDVFKIDEVERPNARNVEFGE